MIWGYPLRKPPYITLPESNHIKSYPTHPHLLQGIHPVWYAVSGELVVPEPRGKWCMNHQTSSNFGIICSVQSHFQKHIWIQKFLGMRLKWSTNLDISYEMRWTIFVDLDKADLINKSGSTQTAWRSLLRFLPAPGNFDCHSFLCLNLDMLMYIAHHCTLVHYAPLYLLSKKRTHICRNPQPNQLLDSNYSHRGSPFWTFLDHAKGPPSSFAVAVVLSATARRTSPEDR